MNSLFIAIYALISYVHCQSYQMIIPKGSKPFMASPQVFEGGSGFMGLELPGFGSNGYGYNQNRPAVQYMRKPLTWLGASNGLTNGNSFKTGYYPVTAGYEVTYMNGNNFGSAKEYTPVFAGHGAPSSIGYSSNNFGVQRSSMANAYSNPTLSHNAANSGTGFKYTNVALPTQYFQNEYKPARLNGYGTGVVNNKFPSLNVYGKQQYMRAVPEGTAQFAAIANFEASLQNIVKMINEEQRKSNGKAIFLIGKPQFPVQGPLTQAKYSMPSQLSFSKANPFGQYKY